MFGASGVSDVQGLEFQMCGGQTYAFLGPYYNTAPII